MKKDLISNHGRLNAEGAMTINLDTFMEICEGAAASSVDPIPAMLPS